MFVLTHHPREPLAMQGGTTFTFVTDGISPALEQARGPPGTRTWPSPVGATLSVAVKPERDPRDAERRNWIWVSAPHEGGTAR